MSSSAAAAAAGPKGASSYDNMEIHELRQALREKGLNASGTKAQLLKRVASFEISREVSQRCGSGRFGSIRVGIRDTIAIVFAPRCTARVPHAESTHGRRAM
jgi:hypothetical protein